MDLLMNMEPPIEASMSANSTATKTESNSSNNNNINNSLIVLAQPNDNKPWPHFDTLNKKLIF